MEAGDMAGKNGKSSGDGDQGDTPIPRRGPGSRHAILDLPEEAFGMASVGCSDSEIADIFKIGRENFKAGLAGHPEVANRLREARAKGTRSVTKALWNRATGQAYADRRGNFLPPDIAAIKFWLCNRARDDWKSEAKLDVHHSGDLPRTDSATLVADMTDEQLLAVLSDLAVRTGKAAASKPDEVN